jgi:hypothetical protein
MEAEYYGYPLRDIPISCEDPLLHTPECEICRDPDCICYLYGGIERALERTFPEDPGDVDARIEDGSSFWEERRNIERSWTELPPW